MTMSGWMNDNRIMKQILKYKAKGRKYVGRSMKI